MKSFLIKSIIIVITITFTGSALYISDKTKSQIKSKTEFQSKPNELDKYYSDKKLGSFVENGKTFFRLFTPNAEKVSLIIFNKVDDKGGKEYEMIRDENAVWETAIDGELYGKYYGFNVKHKDKESVLCLDPYAKAVASYNTYFTPRKGIVVKENDYNWQSDNWIQRDLSLIHI